MRVFERTRGAHVRVFERAQSVDVRVLYFNELGDIQSNLCVMMIGEKIGKEA